MAHLKYLGPHDQISIDGHPGIVSRGDVFECADGLAEQLVLQAGFEAVKSTKNAADAAEGA
jgi:hypothetical protein